MKIGITRHFPVPHRRLSWVDAGGFREWIDWYDSASVHKDENTSLSPIWNKCYVSDINRAVETARALFEGDAEVDTALREVPFAPFPVNGRLPVAAWQALSRVGWWLKMGFQPESRANSLRRAQLIVRDIVEKHNHDNVLIVTHGFFMHCLQKHLRSMGFEGRIPVVPKNGHTYVFEDRAGSQ